VEDALRDRKGHWFEFLSTFRRGLVAAGDKVKIFASRECDPVVAAALQAEAILPISIWARMSDHKSVWRRMLRVPGHAWATWRALRKLLRRSGRAIAPDFIFVPTVLVHHLLGWWLIIKAGLLPKESRILLFFPNLPIKLDENDIPRWSASPTAILMRQIFQSFSRNVKSRRIILGVETYAMQRALQTLIQMPVTYFPHPVEGLPDQDKKLAEARAAHRDKVSVLAKPIVFGCYGAARWEKGTDILQAAIHRVLKADPEINARFVFQWIDDFHDDQGARVRLDSWLTNHPKVKVINHNFEKGEYERCLAETDVMVLPYRSPYRLRVSRVAIDAITSGIPVIATTPSTFWEQMAKYGAGNKCVENSVNDLAQSIQRTLGEYAALRQPALEKKESAQAHFSVSNFRKKLQETIL